MARQHKRQTSKLVIQLDPKKNLVTDKEAITGTSDTSVENVMNKEIRKRFPKRKSSSRRNLLEMTREINYFIRKSDNKT